MFSPEMEYMFYTVISIERSGGITTCQKWQYSPHFCHIGWIHLPEIGIKLLKQEGGFTFLFVTRCFY
jgi:hypothetical protein